MADGAPVDLWIQATDGSKQVAWARLKMKAACGAPPNSPEQAWPLPASMLGGINVAWQALADQQQDGKHSKTDALFDGMTPNNYGWRTSVKSWDTPPEITVDLAGEKPVPVVGFLLNPMGCFNNPDRVPQRFELMLSQDGKEFTHVLEGVLEQKAIEQAFALDKPYPARHARLRLLSSQGNKYNVCLGEWKVVAQPGFSPWKGGGANLADLELGGHVVWASPWFYWQYILSGQGRNKSIRPDPKGNISWAVGFQHNRAARITAFEWRDWVKEKASSSEKAIGEVQISISEDSPLGPWRSLGIWKLDAKEATSRFELKQPVWARFVRFSLPGLKPRQYYALPVTIRIFEQPSAPDGYRSILGEWGHYRQKSYYEFARADDATVQRPATSQGTRERPILLKTGQAQGGEVRFGRDEDWYEIVVGQDQNLLGLTLESEELFKLYPELLAPDGKPVAWLRKSVSGGKGIYQASVVPGRYLLRVAEVPKSVAIVWDQSGSVQSFVPRIYQTLAEFSQTITPQAEYANFLPFQDGTIQFLLKDWSDQPLHLLRALNDYDRKDQSSAAESNLIKATKALGEQPGGRVAILITDAASGEEDTKNEELWRLLKKVRPRIFSVELHAGRGESLVGQQDRMQDWAMANGGHYVFFRTHSDLDTALDRAICKVRRPTVYAIRADLKQLKPGSIRVERGKRSAAGAIELILDASGSMYKKLKSGKTRIGVAREVMGDLVQHVIPPGTPVALRVYGHKKPRICRTDLEVPLAPLDREKMNAIIQRIDPKDRSKTPLADSIMKVSQDLEKVKGKKLVVLVTDGKESCNGDPAKAIQSLKDKGIDVQVNIVGFAIDDKKLKQAFAEWAEIGGGSYFNASNEEELSGAVKDAISPKFEVVDGNGKLMARGVAGSKAVQVPAGTYTVRILSAQPVTLENIVVNPDKQTIVAGE